MQKLEFTIHTSEGFHVRPAKALIDILKKYHSEVTLQCKGKSVNARSILSVLSLQISHNTLIQININGLDEEELSKELIQFFEYNIKEYC